MNRFAGIVATVIILGALGACQSAKPMSQRGAQPAQQTSASSADPGKSLIETEVLGFSPTSDTGKRTIDFSLLFANHDSIKSWKVSLVDDKEIRRKYTGTGSNIPYFITWDGRTAAGALAPDGKYKAVLSVNYGDAFAPSQAMSRSFILDSARPSGKITMTPALFSPSEATDRLTIKIDAAASAAKLDSWSMDIFDPVGDLFKNFSGKGSNAEIAWDGKGFDGDIVVSAEDYPVVVTLRDEFGNVGHVDSMIPIDILVIKQGDGYRIDYSRVFFKGFTADYRDVPPDLAKQNMYRIDQLAAKLKTFPDYKIKIVGHAVMIHWDDAALGKIEQGSILVPLSKARSDAIKRALVDRGLDPKMIETDGAGADDPLVPDSNYANRWRNRRTAIFLIK